MLQLEKEKRQKEPRLRAGEAHPSGFFRMEIGDFQLVKKRHTSLNSHVKVDMDSPAAAAAPLDVYNPSLLLPPPPRAPPPVSSMNSHHHPPPPPLAHGQSLTAADKSSSSKYAAMALFNNNVYHNPHMPSITHHTLPIPTSSSVSSSQPQAPQNRKQYSEYSQSSGYSYSGVTSAAHSSHYDIFHASSIATSASNHVPISSTSEVSTSSPWASMQDPTSAVAAASSHSAAMPSYYSHHPAFLPHHPAAARDFREVAGVMQVKLYSVALP